MSALLVWVIFPGLVATALFFFRSNRRIVTYVGTIVALGLAWVAWQVPIGEAFSFGPIGLIISESFSVLGREFSFSDLERPFLAFLYLSTALWLFGSYYARPSDSFVPVALAIVSLLTAALAVEPFLFAALLIEIAVLISIPLLAPHRKPAGRGVFRFIAFQTFGMPFILFAGWMLAGVGASPSDLELVVRASALLALGFAFLLAVFPFHTWIPMLAREVHPYVAAFLFFILPFVISIFALGFLDRFVWLRESESVYLLLRSVGIVMVVVGGLWAAFETHLGKILGFAAVMEIGLSLAAIGLGSSAGISLYFSLVLPRLISFLIWAIALAFIYRGTRENLSFSAVKGLGLQYPFIVFSLIAAQLSLAGIPLFAGFPPRLVLWRELMQVSSPLVFGALLGNMAFLVSSVRTLLVLMKSGEKNEFYIGTPDEKTFSVPTESVAAFSLILFSLAVGLLLLVGLFPQWFLPAIDALPMMFEHIG
ncbi:MAG: proton-conducting transporter membrane subunit [Chloroflexota bacterium]